MQWTNLVLVHILPATWAFAGSAAGAAWRSSSSSSPVPLAFAPSPRRVASRSKTQHQQKPAFLRSSSNLHVSLADTDTATTVTKKQERVVARRRNPWSANDGELLHRAYSRKRVPSSSFSRQTTEYDYIIVGSGIGGLWLAACLAKFNQTSLVLEQHYTAGGLQHSFKLKGYEFVPGLHYIANLPLVGPMYEMVASPTDPPLRFTRAGNCTVADRGECCSHDLQVGDLPELHVREGLQQNRQELLRVFPNETAGIDKFLSYMEKAKWQSGIFSTLKMIRPAWLQWILSQILCSSYIHTASRSTDS